jgi:hypothetical protein
MSAIGDSDNIVSNLFNDPSIPFIPNKFFKKEILSRLDVNSLINLEFVNIKISNIIRKDVKFLNNFFCNHAVEIVANKIKGIPNQAKRDAALVEMIRIHAGLSPDEAIDLVQQIQNPFYQAKALLSIGRMIRVTLPEKSKVIFEQVKKIIEERLESAWEKNEILCELGKAQEFCHVEEMLEIAKEISSESRKVEVLTHLIRRLSKMDDDSINTILEGVVGLAHPMKDAYWKGQVLFEVVKLKLLKDPDSVLATANTINDGCYKVKALCAVVKVFLSKNFKMAEEILLLLPAVIESIQDPVRRAEALSEMAIAQSDINLPVAFIIAESIEEPYYKTMALCELIKKQGSKNDHEIMQKANKAASSIPEGRRRILALGEIIHARATLDPEQAGHIYQYSLNQALVIKEVRLRDFALQQMALSLSSSHFEIALKAAMAIQEPYFRCLTIYELAKAQPGSAESLIHQVMTSAALITDAPTKAKVLSLVRHG